MPKVLVLFAFLLIQTAVDARSTGDPVQTPSRSAAQPSPKADDHKKDQAPTPGAVQPPQESSQRKEANEPSRVIVEASPPKDAYDKASVWINGVLAFLGVVGMIIAILSLIKLAEQTKATKDAAEAALLNAQAFVNAERARIIFKFEKAPVPNRSGLYKFAIRAVNAGRSPARIISFGTPTEITTAFPEKMAVPPHYPARTEPVDGGHMGPGTSYVVANFIPSSNENQARALESSQAEGVAFVEQNRLIFGEVVYLDGISKEERYSRYCLRFEREPFSNIGGSLVPDGPSQYNDGT